MKRWRARRRGGLATEHCEGSAKLILNPAGNKKLDRVEITSFARGFCWFDELTSGKSGSIMQIAKKEGFTSRYISAVLERAFSTPTAFTMLVSKD